MNKNETIVAIATPLGYSGVGIIKISGKLTKNIAISLLKKIPCPRQAEYSIFYNDKGNIIDKGISIFFPKPNSFTGEDVLELHGHGSPVVLDLIIKNILLIPKTRIAKPGEFSERAFINGKIDLTQAEAIIDLIHAKSYQEAYLAIQSLQGVFSERINKIKKKLIKLRTYIDATIDFSSEDIYIINNKQIKNNLNDIIKDIKITLREAHQGSIIREGIKIVITGKPNVGKSSLLNKIADKEIAIVTNKPGTTRDLIQENINLGGVVVNLTDTAGLRKTDNEIEKIGIKYAIKEIKQANHILFILDSSKCCKQQINKIYNSLNNIFKKNNYITFIRNKSDLTNEKINITKKKKFTIITMSIKFNYGINILKKHIKKTSKNNNITKNCFLARRRHIFYLKNTLANLKKCQKKFKNNIFMLEYISEDLKLAQQSLNEITGKFTSNDLIKKIFSEFCIGK